MKTANQSIRKLWESRNVGKRALKCYVVGKRALKCYVASQAQLMFLPKLIVKLGTGRDCVLSKLLIVQLPKLIVRLGTRGDYNSASWVCIRVVEQVGCELG